MIPATNRGPRGSTPRRTAGSDTGTLRGEPVEFEFEHLAAGSSAESRLDDAVRVEDEGGGGLEHVEVLGDVGPVRQIDVEVTNTFVCAGDLRQGSMNSRAAGAELGAELQQGRDFAEPVRSEPAGLDDLVGDVALGPRLAPPQVSADGERHHQEGGDGDERGDEVHN